jgi:hypothetical protein
MKGSLEPGLPGAADGLGQLAFGGIRKGMHADTSLGVYTPFLGRHYPLYSISGV